MKRYSYDEQNKLLLIDDDVTKIEHQEFIYGVNHAYYSSRDIGKIYKIKFPNNLKAIGDDAFNSCGLKKVTLPPSIKIIGDRAFYDNNLSGKIVFPDSLVSIGRCAFFKCNIDSVEIPDECQLALEAFDRNVKIIRRSKELTITVEKEETILDKLEKDRQKVMNLFGK